MAGLILQLPMMKTQKTIRMLLMVDESCCDPIVRQNEFAPQEMEIAEVGTRDQFLRHMREFQPDVIVAQSAGVAGVPFSSVLDVAAAHAPEVPVVVLGNEDENGDDAIGYLEDGAADYLPSSDVERLPLVIRRVLNDQSAQMHQEQMEVELKQVREKLMENQKLMTIGRLTGSITHEINNPLESVTNLLYLLRKEPGLSKQSEDYLDLADRELERVTQIIRHTLNFCRESNKAVRIKPAALLDEVLMLYRPKIRERQLEVTRQFNSDENLLVFPGEIRQVLSNLVTNAIEASPVGGKLTLRIRNARKWSDEGISGVRIVVADNGSGIDADTRENLGKLFYTTKGQRGTGLGLWVTRAIVARYGGEIQLYSSTRQGRNGTVFSVFMPTNMRPQAVRHDEGFSHPLETEWRRKGRNANREDSRFKAGNATGVFGLESPRSRKYRSNRTPRFAG
jgi:two-component system NtrC family sensor kinase